MPRFSPFRRRMLRAASIVLVLIPTSAVAQGTRAASWLDRPLVNWNKPGEKVPSPPTNTETKAALTKRCGLSPSPTTPAERAVDAGGWVPFWIGDQQRVNGDVEIVGGTGAADDMCRPASYNFFVFAAGRFAGVLSPLPMTSRVDGSAGAVRLPLPQLTVDFARYASTDPLCCPSSHVTVSYRIDRSSAGPVVVPVDVRATRP